MSDADMSRPTADDHTKDPTHAPAVSPTAPGEEAASDEEQQGDHDAADVKQTGGKVANPYMK